jgi:hypothetical protein
MSSPDKIQVELIKLVGGERLLRLLDLASGMTLEMKVDPKLPVLRQKKRMIDVFATALKQNALIPA